MSILVSYFSATGTTARAAEKIARLCGGQLFAIEPAVPYTAADLDWTNPQSRTSLEVKDSHADIALKALPDLNGVTALFVGFPVWWYAAPKIIDSCLSKLNLQNIDVIPFCTSGGTGMEGCEKKLKAQFPDLHWLPGLRITNNESEVQRWIASLPLRR